MANKEYRVTQLLYEKGFVEDQFAYAKYILEPDKEEILAWEITSRNKLEKILHLGSLLRDISCAVPLLQDAAFGEEMQACLARRLSYLPQIYQSRLERVLAQAFPPPQPALTLGIDYFIQIMSQELLRYELGT